MKIKLFNNLSKLQPITIPFRKWELHELPSLRTTNHDMWAVKTSTNLEKPCYVIVCFQDNKVRNNKVSDVTKFVDCDIRNIRIHLNSQVYPYDSMNIKFATGNIAIAYLMYCKFQKSYYNSNERDIRPFLSYNKFKENPLFVFDVSQQNESIKYQLLI